ncbi:hypothetical protein [Deinococcus hohokamensis]|uniref:Uncharacterized protein n=1 Tax=Deinococcus hohokamensis TaxID=309883 RepID=A0ABV9I641_9DEIO
MYSSDLDLITKSRLRETQDVTRAQRPARRHLPRWVKRMAASAAGRVTRRH